MKTKLTIEAAIGVRRLELNRDHLTVVTAEGLRVALRPVGANAGMTNRSFMAANTAYEALCKMYLVAYKAAKRAEANSRGRKPQ